LLCCAVLSAVLLYACGPQSGPTGAPGSGAAGSSGVPPSPNATETETPAPSTLAVSLVTLEPVVSGLEEPLDIAVRPGRPDELYVAEQVGRIRLVRDGALVERPALDIAGLVTAGGEQGFLGIAFHPNTDDGRVFAYYTELDGDQVLASFRPTADDPDVFDPDSQTILLEMVDEFGNHNGGSLAFGPDGYLYVGTGDGGGGGDPLNSGQRLDTLLGKVLRIDVDGDGPDGRPYGIPSDNPFTDEAGAVPEIWLTGLRNPWRLRFDRDTGDLWIGDVGQGAREEVDVARAGVGGHNFGWNVMEGFDCFGPTGAAACGAPEFTQPVADYGHDEGCSVVGGTVYRGSASPDLVGRYVFADFCSGRMWLLDPTGDGPTDEEVALDSGRSISAIGEDAAGELYATDLGTGDLLRIVGGGSGA
jgi:hypothetical protein